MKTIKYGLRLKDTKQILGLEWESNGDSEDCSAYTVRLTEHSEREWMVKDKYTAEYVRNNSTPWYNSDETTPLHDYKPEQLEVIEVEIISQVKLLHVTIPTLKQMLTWKAEKDKGHLRYLDMLEKGGKETRKWAYSLYDLQNYLLDRGARKRTWKDNYGTHLSHCDQGENVGHCKYGDATCPVINNLSKEKWIELEKKEMSKRGEK